MRGTQRKMSVQPGRRAVASDRAPDYDKKREQRRTTASGNHAILERAHVSAPGRAGVSVARARATRDGYQTRPDSRSSVAHAARVQLSQRSWIRLSTRLHSRAVWIQAARQPSVQARILLPKRDNAPVRTCMSAARDGACAPR